jgi:lysophospholipase L1-like esterase
MTAARKLLFSLLTLGAILLLLEVAARVVWGRLENRALEVRHARGETALRNDNINFMKQADGTFGYVLLPGFKREGHEINADGFAQRDRIPLTKHSGAVRLAAMGESTTQGHNADDGNYPVYLGRIIRQHGQGYPQVEVINAGVSGWISDQIALWSEKKVGQYAPDLVVLYVGWNDFQGYDPLNPPATVSSFESIYGSAQFLVDSSPLKLVPLSSALYDYAARRLGRRTEQAALAAAEPLGDGTLPYASPTEVNYRFYLANLDKILAAFRARNPNVKIAMCTLVGRWPAGTKAQFSEENGAVGWMRRHGLDAEQAAATLARFNDLIRYYAKSRDLLLIDVAVAFSALDRGKLQWDFAHMTAEGYELLAEEIYEGLRGAGYLRGEASPRLAQLRDKYRAASVVSDK